MVLEVLDPEVAPDLDIAKEPETFLGRSPFVDPGHQTYRTTRCD
jgi:hypothetical protein